VRGMDGDERGRGRGRKRQDRDGKFSVNVKCRLPSLKKNGML
jgi:hypothetical protein